MKKIYNDEFSEFYNKKKRAIQIHLGVEVLKELDDYIIEQNITTRKKFIEFIVIRFVKNLKK